MSRATLFFFVAVLLPGVLWAQPSSVSFDAATAGSVWGAALSYIAPRSLQPLTIPQMAIWGLNGLAALDPNLDTTLQNGQIRLYGPNQMLIAIPAPAPGDAAAWGQAAARVAAAAYAASPALQQAGTQELISSFFDELFNHFDPYSRYEPPLQAAQDQLMITGLAGTGLTFGVQGGHVVIGTIAADSPAENAGLTVGTLVLQVNGHSVSPRQVSRLNDEMNGLLGTKATLRLQDPSDPVPAPQDITLTRAFIPPQTVFQDPSPAPGVLALKITSFNPGTSDQFSAAVAAAMAAQPPPSGLVLDLRGNRGGILRQAVLVADSLLPSGSIVFAQGRDPDADQSFHAEGADLTSGTRIVVLVDGQTASAAEILSAALADNGRAVVVGSETLGKGLVQTVTSLPDGGELFVTWSRVLAPRGWPMQTLGVMPQVCTSLGDEALQAQLSALQSGHSLMTPALTKARAMRATASVDAILAVRDDCPADIGGDEDFTAAAFLLNNPSAYQAALLERR
ncbi:MAG TPA: S41 family peptidase [Acidocella sp.]|nr:S41 family peptidase [Acidocella sp.]